MEAVAPVRAAAGVAVDELDWTVFYRAGYQRLALALSLYCGDRELGCELAQEAMAKAWRLWPRVGTLTAPEAWTYRVGINLANSAWRRAAVRRRAAGRRTADVDVVPATDVGTAVAVRAAVARLPRRQRSALVLRYFADLPVDEAARLMGCRPGTVAALTAQAIASLRANAGLHDLDTEEDR